MIEDLDSLLKILAAWLEVSIPDGRVKTKDTEGRDWFLRAAKYDKTLKLSDLKNYTDRTALNTEYASRYKQTSTQSKKGVSALKVEISALYSFNKCFVQRYKGRMHFYRDDLSQKGARNMRSVGQAMGLLNEFKKNLDQ